MVTGLHHSIVMLAWVQRPRPRRGWNRQREREIDGQRDRYREIDGWIISQAAESGVVTGLQHSIIMLACVQRPGPRRGWNRERERDRDIER